MNKSGMCLTCLDFTWGKFFDKYLFRFSNLTSLIKSSTSAHVNYHTKLCLKNSQPYHIGCRLQLFQSNCSGWEYKLCGTELVIYLKLLIWTSFSRSFTSICYSADGQCILAGGLSKYVCIYHVKEQILIKKFEISCNLSLDAMEVSMYVLDMG